MAVAGAQMRVSGRELQETRSVVFRGRSGRADDVAAPARHVRPRHFEVVVPVAARSGRVEIRVADTGQVLAARRVRIQARPASSDEPAGDVFFAGDSRRPGVAFSSPSGGPVTVEVFREEDGAVIRTITTQARPGDNTVGWDGRTERGSAPAGRYGMRLADGAQVATTSPPAPFSLYDHIFPIRGEHDLGQSPTNDFGGARSHKGQDMFAACRTGIVAARGGRVRYAGYHAQAGNYVVVTSAETRRDYVYMHMRSTPMVRTGQTVTTRQPLGQVGDSGNASGCHLHFESWTAPGWYAGGSAVDPLPQLRAWDGWS